MGRTEYDRLEPAPDGDGIPRYELVRDATGELELLGLPPLRLRP